MATPKGRQPRWSAGSGRALVIASAAVLAGCATSDNEFNDPYESVNREIFAFNQTIDDNVLEPVAETYRDVVPDPLRANVRNLLRHFNTPWIFVNEVLQGDWEGAEVAASRFFINTIAGLGGLNDVAGGDPELAYRSEDFGQTLAVWGVESGPYLVLPLLGPSTPRDVGGLVVDTVADPVGLAFGVGADIAAFGYARGGASAIDQREAVLDTLDEVERSALDYYAALRSLYQQNRAAEIVDGGEDEGIDIPDYDLEGDTLEDDAVPEPATDVPVSAVDGEPQQVSELSTRPLPALPVLDSATSITP